MLLKINAEDRELRNKLKELTDKYTRYNCGLEKQIEGINNLKRIHSHSIELIEKTNLNDKRICYDYVFNLPYSLVKDCEKNIVGFVLGLIKNQKIVEASDGEIVLYYDKNKCNLKHAGVRKGNFIISKWGGGHIWKHKPEETPSQYGDIINYYNCCISREEVIGKFKKYSKD